MKKILILIMFLFLAVGSSRAQTYYIIGTSKPEAPEWNTGFERSTLPANKFEQYPTIFFRITSMPNDYYMLFMHFKYDYLELSKKRKIYQSDYKYILERPRSELSSYSNLIDVDDMIRTFTKEQADQYMKSVRNKKIYIIDRNDFYIQNGVEMMKLIEVKLAMLEEHDSVEIVP